MTFELDTRLKADTLSIARLTMCDLQLMNDSRWPWVILVPRIEEAIEWHELFADQRQDIDFEISNVAAGLKAVTQCEKINIASLGNSVRQLHIHIVARSNGDANWPGPVWGFGKAVPYDRETAESLIGAIQKIMGLDNS